MSVEHYENFPVASWLCPPAIRPAVVAIYHYARTADDLADEGDAPVAQRLADLAAYRRDLLAAHAGRPASQRWPRVFSALAAAIARHGLPLEPLADLLGAFEQDLVVTRYADRAALLDYCRRSADPVGRLLLQLHGVDDADSRRRSDAVCTALQLANFWQDLSVDTARGRLYVPLDDCARHGVAPAALLAGHDDGATRRLVGELVDWARATMLDGAPLVHRVAGRGGWELRGVVQGGLRILERIEALGCATLTTRPTLSARDALPIAWRALTMRRPRRSRDAAAHADAGIVDARRGGTAPAESARGAARAEPHRAA